MVVLLQSAWAALGSENSRYHHQTSNLTVIREVCSGGNADV